MTTRVFDRRQAAERDCDEVDQLPRGCSVKVVNIWPPRCLNRLESKLLVVEPIHGAAVATANAHVGQSGGFRDVFIMCS
eukprot:363622-Chlamydomonas_euryale.AAC.3